LRTVALLMIGCVLSLAAPDGSASAQKKKSATKSRSMVAKSSAKTTAKHSKTGGKHSKTKTAASWRSRQLAPTPDRYKEIQSALANKGYLSQPANGVWDPQSAEALRHFQRDQNLEPTGKLNSLSLIALGLGAKRTAMVTPAPGAPPALMTPRAPSIDVPPALPQNAIPQTPPPTFVAPELPASPPGDAR
jgi:peptidoglycan hydrolase-like protein with peptidoglycan-binding domain